MKLKRIFLMLMIVFITSDFLGQTYNHNSKRSVDIPEYAPYVDVTLWPTFDISDISTTGICIYTLAFIVDDEHTAGVNPTWGGYTTYGMNFIKDKITALRNSGGKVIVSFGGASGRPLAYVAKNDDELKTAYEKVINAYSLNSIDFDIEGTYVAHHESVNRRSRVLKLLQDAHPQLKISLTLPVMPFGLTNDGLYVVNSAVTNNVKISVVNIMAMDYGATKIDMGDKAIEAMKNTFEQLKTIYKDAGISKTDGQIWKMIGVTPMIGKNDVQGEVFHLDDAVDVRNFAFQKNIGRIAIWSANRDKQCDKTTDPLYACSHIAQKAFEFSYIFKKDGSINYCNKSSNVDEKTLKELKIYPNPARDFIKISGNDVLDIEIIGIDGKSFRKTRLSKSSRKIDISGLKTGIYILDITSGDRKIIKRISIFR